MEKYYVYGINSMGSTWYLSDKNADRCDLWSKAPKSMRATYNSKAEAKEKVKALDKIFEFGTTRHNIEVCYVYHCDHCGVELEWDNVNWFSSSIGFCNLCSDALHSKLSSEEIEQLYNKCERGDNTAQKVVDSCQSEANADDKEYNPLKENLTKLLELSEQILTVAYDTKNNHLEFLAHELKTTVDYMLEDFDI